MCCDVRGHCNTSARVGAQFRGLVVESYGFVVPVDRMSSTVLDPAFHQPATRDSVKPSNSRGLSKKPLRRKTVSDRPLNGTSAGFRSAGHNESSIGLISTSETLRDGRACKECQFCFEFR